MTKFESTFKITNDEIRIHEQITNVQITNDEILFIRNS